MRLVYLFDHRQPEVNICRVPAFIAWLMVGLCDYFDYSVEAS